MSSKLTIHDTTPEAETVLLDLLRNKPAHVRLRAAISSSNQVAEQCKNAIRRTYPNLSEDEVNLCFIELNYGKQLADEVRDWIRSGQVGE